MASIAVPDMAGAAEFSEGRLGPTAQDSRNRYLLCRRCQLRESWALVPTGRLLPFSFKTRSLAHG